MLLLLPIALADPAWLRQPDLDGQAAVFASEGDLWLVDIAGQAPARRLTSHPGEESNPRFSPGGELIAFTGYYDGNPDVYVIPRLGGVPQRVTAHPDWDEVVDWSGSGEQSRLIFRSTRKDAHGQYRLYSVGVSGITSNKPAFSEPTELPIGYAARLDVDPRSGQWAFTRSDVGEVATWKRYRGGLASDIWVGHPDRRNHVRVTQFAGNDSFPMWSQESLLFLSDDGGTANLWSMKPDGSERKQLTQHKQWDVRWPAMAPDGRVVYMLAGDLRIFDPVAGDTALEVTLPGERVSARTRFPDPLQYLTWFSLAPNGDRLLLSTRGELFSVPVEPGVTLPLTRGSGAREDAPSYSPDGEHFVYTTDKSGEVAILTADAWGRDPEESVVKAPGPTGRFHAPLWAPAGDRIAWADESWTLWTAPSTGGQATRVAKAAGAELVQYTWSADGRWLAYTTVDERDLARVWIYEVATGSNRPATPGTYSSHSPAWDPEGRYLYVLADKAMFGTEIRAILLRPEVPNPSARNAGLPPAPSNPAPQATAESAAKKKRKKDKKDKEKLLDPTETPKTTVKIDFLGIEERSVAIPVGFGGFAGLSASAKAIFYAVRAESDSWDLARFDLDEREVTTFASNILAFDVQASKVAVYRSSGLSVLDEAGGTEKPVDLSGLVLEIDAAEEWRQIFWEAWRNQRDYYWDPAMGGLDWKAIGQQYAALLPRIGTRAELNDLIGELIGELGASHTYVWGGDPGRTFDYSAAGLLGCDLVRAAQAGVHAVQITKIYRGDPADDVVSPLLEPGLGVAEGDWILAVNHRPVDQPIEQLLQGLAGRRVLLTVARTAAGEGERQVVVTPLGSERPLRYADQIRRNREYVGQKTGGRVGYLHIPDMGGEGLRAYETWIGPQSDRDGLIVDVRFNSGGWVSQQLLNDLRTPIDGWMLTRQGGAYRYPNTRRRGPFVVITNEFAGSDGDIFPQAVQAEKLAPVIGQRSWGGVIGIRGDLPLVDWGMITRPEYAVWFRGVGFDVENRGVIPDIEVEALPQDLAAGIDAQLDRAIAEVESLIRENPPAKPNPGPGPLKTREAYQQREGSGG